MRTAKLLAMCGVMVLMSGCYVVSLHPFFTEESVVFDQALVGTWTLEKQAMTFKQAYENAYTLICTDEEGERCELEACLARVGNFLFLDVYPKEIEDCSNGLLVPAHSVMRVWIEGDVLRVAGLNYEWVRSMIDEKKLEIAHEYLPTRAVSTPPGKDSASFKWEEKPDNPILLTASSKNLQDLCLKYGDDKEAFAEPGEFHRQR